MLTQLFCRSDRSGGSFPVKSWVDRTIETESKHLCLLDENHFYSVMSGNSYAKKNGINYIPAIQYQYVDTFTRTGNRYIQNKVVFIANSLKSYKKIVEINNHIALNQFYYTQRCTLENTVDALRNDVPTVLQMQFYKSYRLMSDYYFDKISFDDIKSVFDNEFYKFYNKGVIPESLFFSVPVNESIDDVYRTFGALKFIHEAGLKTHLLIASSGVYPDINKKDIALAYLAISNNSSFPRVGSYIRSNDELTSHLNRYDLNNSITDLFIESCDITDSFADACTFSKDFTEYDYILPHVDTGKKTTQEFYDDLIVNGWNKHATDAINNNYPDNWGDENCKIVSSIDDIFSLKTERSDRLKLEYEVNNKLGFVQYYLLAWLMISYTDRVGLYRNIYGRGSGAGSFIVYLLGITGIDPITHHLLFERFLNEERVLQNKSLPDLDLDFAPNTREQLREYLEDQYGKENVISINTFSAWGPSSLIKSMHKYLDGRIPINGSGNALLPEQEDYVDYPLSGKGSINEVTANADVRKVKDTLEPREYIDQCVEKSIVFKEFYSKHSDWIENIILPLCGMINTTGVHAGGVIIIPEEKKSVTPFKVRASDKTLICHYDKKEVETAGLVKMDLLVVNAADMIGTARKFIKEVYGDTPIDAFHLRRDDPKVLAMFHDQGHGIFQFKSPLQLAYQKQLQADSFSDLVSSVALLRTGPMQANAHKEYIEAKNGKELTFEHPVIEEVLMKNGGILFLQEQVMEISQKFSGFSKARADDLRKATASKSKELVAALKEEFIQGAIDLHSVDRSDAESVWVKIEYMAEYLFNLSHAVSYTALSYEMMYLKTYWPMAAWAGILEHSSSDSNKTDSIYAYKGYLESAGVHIQHPTYKAFYNHFYPEGSNTIHWPIGGLKDITDVWADSFVNAEGNKSFSSIKEMIDVKVNGRTHLALNKFKALVFGGFFDNYPHPSKYKENDFYNPGAMKAIVDYYEITGRTKTKKTNKPIKKGMDERRGLLKVAANSKKYFVENTNYWKSINIKISNVFPSIDKRAKVYYEFESTEDGDTFHGAGVVSSIRHHRTKAGKQMMYVDVMDVGAIYRLTIFPKMYASLAENGSMLSVGYVIEFLGKKQDSEDWGVSVLFGDDSQIVIREKLEDWRLGV